MEWWAAEFAHLPITPSLQHSVGFFEGFRAIAACADPDEASVSEYFQPECAINFDVVIAGGQ